VSRSTWASRALVPLLAAAASVLSVGGAAGATGGPVQTLAPIGGDYTPDSLAGFARVAAERATAPSVDILVVPSAYGTTPSIGQNTELAQKRTDQIAAACQTVVSAYPGVTGCSATLVPLFTRADAQNAAYATMFDNSSLDGIFILGGDQDLAMETLAATPVETAMAAAYRRGVVVSGTSAGDAVESRNMIFGFTDSGSQDNELQQGSVLVWWGDDPDLQRGLSFGSTATILDQHFYQMGRFGRLLNVVARSEDRFDGAGKLGVGVDLGTGVRLTNDAQLSGVFGASSAAIIDGETAAATHSWQGPDATLSARNLLTHLLPAGGFSYDVARRLPYDHGKPRPFHSPGPWTSGLLQAPGPGVLLLGGDTSGDLTGPAMSEFVQRAKAAGGSKIVEVFAGYASTGGSNHDAGVYRKGVADAGWTGAIEQIVYGQHALSASDLTGAAGVLFVGGDQSSLAAPVADRSFRTFVRSAIANAPVVMTERAMTAAMGQWYSALPEPTPTTLEDQAIDDFRSGFVTTKPGLGILPGAEFEPRLTADYRWGRLYGLAQAHPAAIAFGICAGTAIELASGSATVIGDLSVVSADGRAASFGTGTNGAMAAFNVLLNAYAPGEAVTG
jgi:cyanophycinase